jgi:hypothetical protein
LNKDFYLEQGRKIIEAVGLPLVSGTPESFGAMILSIQVQRMSNPRETRQEIEQILKDFDLIIEYSRKLKSLLLKRQFTGHDESRRQDMANFFLEIEEYYLLEECSKHRSILVDNLCEEEIGPIVPIHLILADIFRDFFGKEPTYTYSETEGYPGSFWDFIRALHDIALLNISPAGIRKAHQRSKKETR